MKSFIRKLDKTLELDKAISSIDGFKYVPKHQAIKEIIIVNPELIDKLIGTDFDKKYKNILELYLKALEDEGDCEGTLMKALGEVNRLRSIIIRKYQRALSKKTLEKLLKKLKILENELRIKIIDYKLIEEQQKIPEKGITR